MVQIRAVQMSGIAITVLLALLVLPRATLDVFPQLFVD